MFFLPLIRQIPFHPFSVSKKKNKGCEVRREMKQGGQIGMGLTLSSAGSRGLGAPRYVTIHRMCTNKGICPPRLMVEWNIRDVRNARERNRMRMRRGAEERLLHPSLMLGRNIEKIGISIHSSRRHSLGTVFTDRGGCLNGCERIIFHCVPRFSHIWINPA